MLSKRYYNDGKPSVLLNPLQLKYKKIIENKVNRKKYVFEKINCIVCGLNDFEILSEKDRYGLYASIVICKECGLMQTNPKMDELSYHEFFQKEYRKLYTSTQFSIEEYFKMRVDNGKGICEYIESITNKSIRNQFIVEIGAGIGGILSFFQKRGNKVLGMDLGLEYIKYGRSKGVNLIKGTVKELSKIRPKPDLVIYAHTIGYLFNPVEELKILKKILKPESLVYIEVPSIKNLVNSYNRDLLRYLQNAHTYYFTLNSLINCAKVAGFKLISGNEKINSLFKVDRIDKTYKSDYKSTIEFLKKLEKTKTKPLSFYKIKNKVYLFTMSILSKTKTLNIARNIYDKFKINFNSK